MFCPQFSFFFKKKSGILCIFNSTSCIMHWTGKTLNLTISCLSIKFVHHMLIFGLNQTFLVDPLPICNSYIRMNYSEHNYHVTKLMCSDQLRNSFGKNDTMGPLKGIIPFTSKIFKSVLFAFCHTSVMTISLRIWCSLKQYLLVWWFSFFSLNCCLTVN